LGVTIIRRVIPCLLFTGILFTLVGGILILSSYSDDLLLNVFDIYDSALVINLFNLGIILVILVLIYSKVVYGNKTIDNRISDENTLFSRKDIKYIIEKNRSQLKKTGDIAFISTIVSLIIIFFIDPDWPFRLALVIAFIVVLSYSFVRIIIYEDFEEKAETESKNCENNELSWWLKLIDYRNQPISISLILFIVVILSYQIFDNYDFELEGSYSGSSRHYMTLAEGTLFLTYPILVSSFIYISHHYNFLGFDYHSLMHPYQVSIRHIGSRNSSYYHKLHSDLPHPTVMERDLM
jgi:hypothetical protein